MATTTFDKEFKLLNSKEADTFADVMSSYVSPILRLICEKKKILDKH